MSDSAGEKSMENRFIFSLYFLMAFNCASLVLLSVTDMLLSVILGKADEKPVAGVTAYLEIRVLAIALAVIRIAGV